VNATGNKVVSTHHPFVQVVFMVETTLYDGVYNASIGNYGGGVNGPDPCSGPCRESDGVPFFVNNVANITSGMTMRNTGNATSPGVASSPHVTFALADYSASDYNVDIPSFSPAGTFAGTVSALASQGMLFGNGWVPSKSILGDSDFSKDFLESPMISAMNETLRGQDLGWISNSTTLHVIVWIGSTLPGDPGYQGDYCATYYTGAKACPDPTPTCNEPAHTSPSEMKGSYCPAMSDIATLAKSEGVTIDTIDLPDGMTEAGSGDYDAGNATQTAAADNDVTSILFAGCYLAQQTGGSWEGPSPASTGVGFACSAAPSGTGGAGNLTNTFRTTAKGNYSWADNPSLGWALTNVTFPVIQSTSSVAAFGTQSSTFNFIPFVVSGAGFTFTTAGESFTCISNNTLNIDTACDSAWNSYITGGESWGWPYSQMWLNDSWSVVFNISVSPSFPAGDLNNQVPVDVCATSFAGCQGTGNTGLGANVLSEVSYSNYRQSKAVQSFPPAFVTVIPAPIEYVAVTPSSATVATNDTTGPFNATPVCPVTCPAGATYQWNLTNGSLGTLDSSTGYSVTFTANGTVGTVTLFVNVTLEGVTIMSAPVPIVIITTLKSVSVTPSWASLAFGHPQLFNATIDCAGVCPSGATYSWTMTRPYGTFNTTTGDQVEFTTDTSADVHFALFVNATLNGVTMMSAPIPISMLPTLEGIIVSPDSATVAIGGSQLFIDTLICSGTTSCPDEAWTEWSLSSSYMGSLMGAPVGTIFTAGNHTGTVELNVSATLNGVTCNATPIVIDIVSSLLPMINSFTVSPSIVDLGSWTAFTVNASGGIGSLTYTYTGLPAGCPSENQAVLLCRSTEVGQFSVGVTVTDQDNNSAMDGTFFTVEPVASGPVITSFTVTPTLVEAGSQVTFMLNVSGGIGFVTFHYVGLPPGCTFQDVASASCVPDTAGNYTVRVFANDSAGYSATATAHLVVTANSAPTSILYSPVLLDGILTVFVLGVVAVMITGNRKKKGKEPETESQPVKEEASEPTPTPPSPPRLPPAGSSPPTE
jgi:hypothetical protein